MKRPAVMKTTPRQTADLATHLAAPNFCAGAPKEKGAPVQS